MICKFCKKIRVFFLTIKSDFRFAMLRFWLKRFCEKDLDQWERWRLKTKNGDMFIQITRVDDGYNYHSID